MKEKKKKRFFNSLSVRILAAIFGTVLLLQTASTFVVYRFLERDLESKRAEDLDDALDSVVYNLSSPYVRSMSSDGQFTNITASQLKNQLKLNQEIYTELAPKYREQVLAANSDDSDIMDEYLREFASLRKEKQGIGMSLYGDAQSALETFLATIASPSCSKFVYAGFVDKDTNDFVVTVGAFESREFRGYENTEAVPNVITGGYFFPWAPFSQNVVRDEIDGEGFIGYRYSTPTKGRIYASARRLYFTDTTTNTVDTSTSYWVFLESDIAFFTDQTSRFSLTFLYTSLGSFAVLFLVLGFLIYWLSIRRIKRLSDATGDAVKSLQQGNLSKTFGEYSGKHPDEIDGLNDDIAYFQSQLLTYMEEREATIKEEERNRAEMAFSAQIQLSSLPSKPVHDDHISIYPAIRLAKDVGGDLYDYFYIDDHRFIFLIGDVSGKGVPAALFMMQAIAKIKTKLNKAEDFHLGEEIRTINDELCANNPMNLFVTFFIGVADTSTGELDYVNCGHEEAFFRHGNGDYQMLEGPSNLPLGAVEGFEFEMRSLKLKPGDSLFLYTDGVSEAESIEGEFFGKPRIGETLNGLAHLSGAFLAEEMMNVVVDFQKGKEQSDDICMLYFTFVPHKEFLFDNKLENLDAAQDFVDEVLSGIADPEALSNIHLGLDELLTNVILYAYGESEGKIILSLDVDAKKKKVIGSIVDRGVAFNPLEQASNQDIANTPGGLGILIAKSVYDELIYSREGDYNVLFFHKKI